MAEFSKRSREGYLVIDHRASPGTNWEPGSGFPSVPEGQLFETRTLSCPHCGCCVVVNMDRTRQRPHCHSCDHYICDICAIEYKVSGVCRTYIERALGVLRKTMVSVPAAPDGAAFPRRSTTGGDP